MGSHPANLALRFVLELVTLFAIGYWGWTQHESVLRFVLAFGLPLIAAALWGTFRVPDDPGKAPVAIPGIVRLVLELAVLGSGVWAVSASGKEQWAVILAAVLLIHYAVSYDRIMWMLKR